MSNTSSFPNQHFAPNQHFDRLSKTISPKQKSLGLTEINQYTINRAANSATKFKILPINTTVAIKYKKIGDRQVPLLNFTDQRLAAGLMKYFNLLQDEEHKWPEMEKGNFEFFLPEGDDFKALNEDLKSKQKLYNVQGISGLFYIRPFGITEYKYKGHAKYWLKCALHLVEDYELVIPEEEQIEETETEISHDFDEFLNTQFPVQQ